MTTLSQQAMMLAGGGALGSDDLTENVRRLGLALEARGVTRGDVRHEDETVLVDTHVRGRAVTIRVSAHRFELPGVLTDEE